MGLAELNFTVATLMPLYYNVSKLTYSGDI